MACIGLASQSPRRRELLAQLGVAFRVVNVSVEEQRHIAEAPADYVLRLAENKARAGASVMDAPVLGADTVVVQGERVLEKPKDEADFLAMMASLSGATHSVYTGLALCVAGQCEALVVQTQVRFRAIEQAEALRYWATGEPCDKAGGYGIQGFGAAFVEHIQGSYSNVVGLPLFETAALLGRHQLPIWNSKAHE